MPLSGAAERCVSTKLTYKVPENFVGLDLSLTSTGMSFLTGDGMVDTFNFKTEKSQGSHTARIAYLRDKIVLTKNAFSMGEKAPKLIAMEGYAMGIRGGMSFTLGELGGVVKEEFRRQGVDVLIVPPHNLKKFIQAKGTGKEFVRVEVFKRYGIELPTNDETDAFVLSAMAHAWHIKNVMHLELPKYQEEALEKCEYVRFGRVSRNAGTV